MPASGCSSVASMRIVVVLPAPFGPSTPYTAPRRTARSMPSTARVSPKALTRPVGLDGELGHRDDLRGQAVEERRPQRALVLHERARVGARRWEEVAADLRRSGSRTDRRSRCAASRRRDRSRRTSRTGSVRSTTPVVPCSSMRSPSCRPPRRLRTAARIAAGSPGVSRLTVNVVARCPGKWPR